MFGLLGFLAAAGYSINKQRRTEVWDAGVCVLQRPLRALDRRLSCTIMSPHLEGLPVPHKRKSNLGYLRTSAQFGAK